MEKDQDKILLKEVTENEYKYGFVTNIETDQLPRGLNEEIVRGISGKNEEPDFILKYRLKAFRHWLKMVKPRWAHLQIPDIDFQNIIYYSAPKQKPAYERLEEVDPEILNTYERLGIPLEEQKHLTGVAVDAIMDSVSVKTTFQDILAELGIIFCPMDEAIRKYPDLIRKYMGTVIPYTDNYYAALNAAVFSGGSFCYIPKGVHCPMELSSYIRLNAAGVGQFERSLIIADEDSYVSYLEGCTAPIRDKIQLHAGLVELVALENAEIKFSGIQNWYPGNKEGRGGVFNFANKRGICKGNHSKILWVLISNGSAISWEYPSTILKGDHTSSEFYSVAVTNNYQQADTGSKMIHIGKNTSSTIVSKGISAGYGSNSYRGLVKVSEGAENARNFSQCDSLLIGSRCDADTFPYIEVGNNSAIVEHEATTSKIGEDQIFYFNQRGISSADAIEMIVTGYAQDVLEKLPMEFALEARKLLQISLEGSIG